MTQLKSKVEGDSFPSLVSDFFNSEKFFGPGRWFDKTLEDFVPAVNIKETDKQFKIEMAVPGFDKSDFKIHVHGDLLSIEASKKEEKQDVKEQYTRKEYSYNSFSRRFTLPQNTNAEEVQATYENGILNLTVAKRIETKDSGRKEIRIS